MKSTTLLLILCMASIAYSQESKSKNVYPETELPPKETSNTTQNTTAQMDKNIDEASFVYSFTSNKPLTFERAEAWESRFLVAFPYLEEIQIDATNQSISIRLPQTHSNQELLDLLEKFGYTDFQIAN